jgi:hypothetical protein
MPQFLERKLRANVPRGVDADRYVYGAMNNMGAMRGSKITPKGRAMEKKHNAKMKKRVHRGVTDFL